MMTFFGNRSQAETGNVVSMDRFRTGRSLSPIRQAEAYWSALRTGDEVPNRSDIDPRGLENVLDYTFILERIAPGIARFRLAGNHLNKLAGMEVRGMPLTAFFAASARKEISATLEHLFDTPAVAELHLHGERKFGRSPLEARMILLPLRSDFGDVSRVLGVMVADGVMGATPHRFDIARSELRDVHKRQYNPQSGPIASDQPAEGGAENHPPLSGEVPSLRLVKSDLD